VHKRISLRAIAIPVVLMGLTALMVTAVPSAASAQGLQAGTFVNHDSGKCMSNGGSTANSAPITQYKCNGSGNQMWYWDEYGTGDYTEAIFNYTDYSKGISMCLTDGGSTADNTPITQYSCNGSVNQQWYLIAVSSGFHIENINGFCMTNGGSKANSAPITQATCNNSTKNQEWTYDGDGF
jgi:hypothetical protein